MTETQIVEFLQSNAPFFTTNNIVITTLRIVGWMLVKGLCALIDICKELYDRAFGLLDITQWLGLENFIGEFQPFLMTCLFLSIVVLGFMYMFGKNKKHNILASILIFGVVVTSSNYLFLQLNTWTVMFKDAVVGTEGTADGAGLVRTCLFDLIYIEEQLGLENLTGSEVPQYASLAKEDLSYIDINEVVDFNREGISDTARDILKKRLLFKSAGETGLQDVSGGVAWTDFGNTFYYRYTFQYGTFFLNALAVLLIYICLAYKSVRIIYEILVSRILATLKSADMSSTKKTVVTLECIRDGYYSLCFTAITLRSYFLFAEYLSGQREMSGVVRAILLLFVAFCVVDGANVMQKITGVDAGLSSMAGKLIAGYHLVRGGMQSVQQARQFHMMKQQRDAMKQMKEGGQSQNSQNEKSFQNMDDAMSGQDQDKQNGNQDAQPEQNESMEAKDRYTEQEDESVWNKGAAAEQRTPIGEDDMSEKSMEPHPAGEEAEQKASSSQQQSMGEGKNKSMFSEEGLQKCTGGAASKSDFTKKNHQQNAAQIKPTLDCSRVSNGQKQTGGNSTQIANKRDWRSRFEQDEHKNMFDRWDVKSQKKRDRAAGLQHITEEKVGRDRYVGGDGGSEKKKRKE